VANFSYFRITFSGSPRDLAHIADRIAAGFGSVWVDDVDVSCELPAATWGRWGEGDGAVRMWITPPRDEQPFEFGAAGDELVVRGVAAWAPPVDLAERITAIWPGVTARLTARMEHAYWEDWEFAAGSARLTGGVDLHRNRELDRPWSDDESPTLRLWHHEAPVLADDELTRLRAVTCEPRTLVPPPDAHISRMTRKEAEDFLAHLAAVWRADADGQ
jgi:hypothetical protein